MDERLALGDDERMVVALDRVLVACRRNYLSTTAFLASNRWSPVAVRGHSRPAFLAGQLWPCKTLQGRSPVAMRGHSRPPFQAGHLPAGQFKCQSGLGWSIACLDAVWPLARNPLPEPCTSISSPMHAASPPQLFVLDLHGACIWHYIAVSHPVSPCGCE
jgi:hypothetical protein